MKGGQGESGRIVWFCLISAYWYKNVFILANAFLGPDPATPYSFLTLSYEGLSLISGKYLHGQLLVGLKL